MVQGARYLRVRLANDLHSTGYAGFADLSLTLSESSDQVPTITSVADQAMIVGSSIALLAFTVADADTSVNDLTVAAASSNTTLIPNSSDSLRLSRAAGCGICSLTIIPVSGETGQSTVTLTVSDGTEFTQASFIIIARRRRWRRT